MGENSITKIITFYANTIKYWNVIAKYIFFSFRKERDSEKNFAELVIGVGHPGNAKAPSWSRNTNN